jgi:hypothetical protein
MESLPIEFTGTGEVAGVVFKQLFRHLDLCLYSRDNGRLYEVIKARYQKAGSTMMGGVKVEFKEKERYPKGEDWGKYEWCVRSIEEGIEKYNAQAASMKYEVVLTKNMLNK